MNTIFETKYEKYGTQHITVRIGTVTFPDKTNVYQILRETVIPTHPQNNSEEIRIFTITDAGVAMWLNVNRVIPADIIREYFIDRVPAYNKEATDAARSEQINKFVAEYRASMENHVPSDEEMFEMRAAFGTGTEVVNVITGRKTRL